MMMTEDIKCEVLAEREREGGREGDLKEEGRKSNLELVDDVNV